MQTDPSRQPAIQVPNQSGSTKTGRFSIFVATATLTVMGLALYWQVISVAGVNWVELLTLPLFGLLFGWIVFSFVTATAGLIVCLRPSRAGVAIPATDERPLARCAILIPVYNENPRQVFARVEAMLESLNATGQAAAFDIFVLSDTTDANVWLEEEIAWSRLMESVESRCAVYYRHRSDNVGRKAGNIADFCERWGSGYAFMIVLDADSLVAGHTMVEMLRRMQADDRLGILQAPPLPVGRESLFARLQQFAAQLYGPVFATGFQVWAGDQGNYWGHNAILRVDAFRECCDLPLLPGEAPLGGHILSHDFVEAALMVRHGWKVRLATDLTDSFEECPTTITDFVIRDQRWCQGNLQHSSLIVREGFHPCSRLHFVSGVLSYAASPLWILFMVLCIVGWSIDGWTVDGATATEIAGWLGWSHSNALLLFVASMAMLMVPKIYAWAVCVSRGRASSFGGHAGLLLSVVLETFASILLSPIMAIYHSRFVTKILMGGSVRWSAQQRDDSGVNWSDAIRQFGTMTLCGIAATAALALIAPEFLLWFSPLLAGWVLSIPVAVAMGSPSLGRLLRRWGLLLIPQEIIPTDIHKAYHEVLHRRHGPPALAATGSPAGFDPFERVIEDPICHLLHSRVLKAGDASVPLDDQTRESIRSLMADGPRAIPATLRTAVLKDGEFLQELHLTRQISGDRGWARVGRALSRTPRLQPRTSEQASPPSKNSTTAQSGSG